MSRFTQDQSLLEQYRHRSENLARENANLRVEIAALKAEIARLTGASDKTVGHVPGDLG